VRGTPQQIIDKYNQLARDSQLSGDRVATENFQQHAEHYTRMLAEAMREQEAKREAHEAQQRERQQQRNQEREERETVANQQPDGGRPQPEAASQDKPRTQDQRPARQPVMDAGDAPQPDVIDMDAESGLVETPESKPAPKPKPRRPRKKPVQEDAATEEKPAPDSGPAEAAE